MATKPYTIPRANSPFSEGGGNPTREWYNYLLYVGNSSSGNADALLNDITIISEKLGSPDGTPENIPPLSEQTGRIVGQQSILSNGVLPGIVTLQLAGDEGTPGNTFYYGTSSEGTKGFYTIASAFLGSDGDITLAVGDDGVTTIDLADVSVGTGGSLKKYGFDPKGRLSEEDDATTDDLNEGATNLYFTDARAKAAAVADTINPAITDVAPSQHAVSVALDEKIDESEKGEPNGVATLDSNGKLDAGQLPDLAITQTFVVASQAAMLALDCQQGDVAVRTDLSESFILTADPPSTLANWQQLLTPTSPVTSVFGRTGSVTAATGDYTFSQIGSTPTTLSGYGITDAVPSSRTISTGTGLSGGGDLSANRTVALENTTVSPGSYGDATHVATFTVDAQGRLTAAGTAAIPVSTGTVTSVALTMPADFSVSGSPITSSGTFGVTYTAQSANVVHAGPASGAAATPTWRALVAADIPDLSGTYQPLDADLTAIAALSTTGIAVRTAANTWSTRTLSNGTGISLSNADGTAGNPVIGLANTAVSAGSYGDATHVATFTVDAQGRLTSAGSTAISFPASSVTSVFGRTGAVVATSGDYNFSLISGTAAATQGGTGQSTYTLGDILYSSATNALSKLPGNTTTAKQYLSQKGTGTVSAAPAWAAIAGADVTGAALTKTDDTNVTLTLGGTPATALLRAASITVGWSGTLSIARGGTGQATASAAFDALAPTTTSQDLIVRGASGNGRLGVGANGTVLTVTGGVVGWSAPATSGTVTSVGLSLPSIFTVSGSPVTSSGTLTGTLANQAANSVFAGPVSGSAAAPSFRALVSADVPLPTDYISGLKLIWNSATSISVGTGSAVIPSTGKLETVSATLTLSSLALSASTFYHVYLYDNAGTPTLECVTTAPAAPYQGTARAKTGDTTRRYLGSVLTDSSGNLVPFSHAGTTIFYDNGSVGAAPYRVLSNGTATTSTSVSLTGIVPVSAQSINANIINLASAGTLYVQRTTGTNKYAQIIPTTSSTLAYVNNIAVMPISGQAFGYFYDSAPIGGGAYIDVYAYTFAR